MSILSPYITWYQSEDTGEIISDEEYTLRSMDSEMDDWNELSKEEIRAQEMRDNA